MPKYRLMVDFDSPREEGEHLESLFNSFSADNEVEAERLVDIRKNRMMTLKERENTSYTNIQKIKEEVEGAKKTFAKYKWPTIDVTRKSVEETAASIIKIHEIYKKNG